MGLGHPHVTTEEIHYNGMRIPKGSHIHLNGYAIHHDPNRHPDPDRFWPERYEGDHTSVMQSINSSNVHLSVWIRDELRDFADSNSLTLISQRKSA